jgi:8-oxo-dGTP pyrophosphatase MutT (NUDIX family)
MHYVAGFMFEGDTSKGEDEKIILIRKNKPAWQAGLCNAVGGKVENYETPVMAMQREFKEETDVLNSEWQLFASLSCKNGDKVDFFYVTSASGVGDVEPMTEENLVIVPLRELSDLALVPNLHWLVRMALEVRSRRNEALVYHLVESSL